jgi:peptidoglycan/LPS O-acetylase OafA/YrhL
MAPLTATRPAGSHLKYLEGLRGLAAVVVALQHVYHHTLATASLTGWQAKISQGLDWAFPGRASVAVFIVLSGYFLMRPVARAGSGKMPGGVLAYIYRRARRILPPYYAALFFSIALILAVPALRGPVSGEWADAVPALGAKNLVAHLLLIHNLSYNWASKIDPGMWTIATEWQIYFLFPLLLLPMWRRLGNAGMVTVGMGLGLGLFLLTGKGHAAAPWFLGLFALGAAVAAREASGKRRPGEALRLGWLAAILFAIFAVITFECAFGMLRFLTVHGMEGTWPYFWAFDVLIGIATACLLIFASASIADQKPHLLVRWLSSRWLVRIGVASYTLYLIHDPILAVLKLGLDRIHLGPFEQFAAMILVGGPIVLAATYLFHIVFERPFMTTSRVRGAEN